MSPTTPRINVGVPEGDWSPTPQPPIFRGIDVGSDVVTRAGEVWTVEGFAHDGGRRWAVTLTREGERAVRPLDELELAR